MITLIGDRREVMRLAVGGFAMLSTPVRTEAFGPTLVVTAPPFAADSTGRDNSTTAFRTASEAINAAGGGTLVVPPGRYRVGRQRRVSGAHSEWAFAPEAIIDIRECRAPVAVVGDGATLFCDDGLRYGSFEPHSGAVAAPRLPFTDRAFRASPYVAMIRLAGNRASVRVSGFELDGRSAALAVGGGWNDHGIQIDGSGIEAYDNADLTIEKVRSHHHPLDGILIGAAGLRDGAPSRPHRLLDCRFEYNGRQGLSWVGGNDLEASRCRFAHTGRGRLNSAPGAGVDIEPEDSICRNARFNDCTFIDNAGVGLLVHDPGAGASRIACSRCMFVGTTNWTSWPAAPRMLLSDCTFVGALTNAHADPDPALATQFTRCHFLARSQQFPGIIGYAANYLTAEIDRAENVRFSACQFDSAGSTRHALVYLNGGVVEDCEFRQDGGQLAVLRSRFLGTNRVVTRGPVEFAGGRSPPNVSVVAR